MTAHARSVPLGLAGSGPATPAVRVEPDTVLGRREALLRSVATVCLAGIALVQAIGLRARFEQGPGFAVPSLAVMTLCVGLGLVLAAAPAAAAAPVWRLVAAAAAVVLAAWALPRALATSGLERTRGDWGSAPGAVCGGLAIGCLTAAAVAGWPPRPSARVLAGTLAVMVAMAPGVWMLLVGLGPAVTAGEPSAATSHVHAHGLSATASPVVLYYRPVSGRKGGRYLVPVALPARHSPLGLGLVVAPALVFTAGAVAHLRRRSRPGLTAQVPGRA